MVSEYVPESVCPFIVIACLLRLDFRMQNTHDQALLIEVHLHYRTVELRPCVQLHCCFLAQVSAIFA